MIIVSNNAAQTIAPGQSVIFDRVIRHCGNGECFREGMTSIKLRGDGLYDISYGANITNTAAGPVQLSLQLGGGTLPETTAISTPAAVGDFNNVSRSTSVRNCCGDFDRITLTNTGTADVVVGANSVVKIVRRS